MHAGSEQFGEKNDDDDCGGVDHRPPNLEGGFADDLKPWARCLQPDVLAQPPQYVLDADDRIVHQHAERHGEAAQGHGVEGETHAIEHSDRGEQ